MCQLLLDGINAHKTLMTDKRQAADTVLEGKGRFRIETVIVNQLVFSLRLRIDAHSKEPEMFKVVTDFNKINADRTTEYAVSMANI